MTHNQFIRLSGWGMILGAMALLLTLVPGAQIQTSIYRVFGALPTLSGDGLSPTTVDQIWGIRFLVAIILIALGLIGLLARYGDRVGNTSKLALSVGVLGGLAGVVSNLLWVVGYDNGRTLMNLSMAVMFAGLFVFGLMALRTRPMPRGNGLPVLAGLWWPFIVIGANVYHQITGQWLNVPWGPSFALFLGMSVSLMWLGYILQADARPEQTA